MSTLKRTPLFDFNKANGGRMVDFAGWEMPVQFKSILDEHKATRSAAGIFDVSHMGEATVSGSQAAEFLDHALTNDIGGMAIGRVVYSLMLYPHGGVVDDLLVYRESADTFLLCLNASNAAKDVAWLTEQAANFDVEVCDVSDEYALVAVQGPKTFGLINHLTNIELEKLGYYWFAKGFVAGVPCLISRTGYTGEKGVELFVPPDRAEDLVTEILREGSGSGVELAGLGARDSLRLEAGYSLYGHEIDENISPVQANLMWTVKFDKGSDFIGKQALLDERKNGPERRVVFFKTGSRRIVRAGTRVEADEGQGGVVLSGGFSPILNEAIGSALISADSLKADLAVDLRGAIAPLFLSKPPFIPLAPQA